MRGRFDAARAMLVNARSIFDDLGQTAAAETDWRPAATYVQLLAGDYLAAEHDLREGCAALEASGDLAYLGTRAAELAELLVRTRREEEADRWCEVASRSGAVDDIQTQAGWRSARARILARRGAVTEAHTLAEQAVSLTEPTDHLNQRAHCLLSLAEILRMMGRIDEAFEVARRATDLYAQKGNVVGMKQAQASLVETPAR
jgi:tetratricopeptide (TPR) repeat protein